MKTETVDRIHREIHTLVSNANNLLDKQFSPYEPKEGFESDAANCIEAAFVRLMVLYEELELLDQLEVIKNTFHHAKRTGLDAFDHWEAESAWSVWARPIRLWSDTIRDMFGEWPSTESTPVDLVAVIRRTQSAINDKNCFEPPKNESDVHNRIEMILRSIYPDVQRKPPISGSVKSFIPDTGIPSLKALIEYKFLSDAKQAPTIADEILADVSGYRRDSWRHLIFVIYETRRFKSEHEWQQLLLERGIRDTLVLIHGEPPSLQNATSK